MINAATASAFRRWRGSRAEHEATRRVGLYVAGRMMKLRLASAFAGFACAVSESARRRSLVVAAVSRMRNGMLSRAWQGWVHAIRELHRLISLSLSAIEMFRGSVKRRAFAKWLHESDPERVAAREEAKLRRREEVKHALRRCAEQESLMRGMADELVEMRRTMREDLAALCVPVRARHVPTVDSPPWRGRP